MASPRPLPSSIAQRPFTIGEGAHFGVSRARLQRPGLSRTTYGARSLIAPADVWDHVAGVVVALPRDVAVSHATAARLWDLPVPTRWSRAELVHTMRTSDRTPLRRRGVRGHRGLELRRVETQRGIRLVSAADTWCDLAAASWDLDDLVVVGDALVNWRHGIRPDVLDAAIAKRSAARGVEVMRAARALLRRRSESPMETRARLLFARAGLPEPELNEEIHHSADSQWLATGDFVWREQRVVGEYAGDQHRTDPRQWRGDVKRREDLEDDGWRMVVFTSEDIFARPSVLLSRLDRQLRRH